MRAGTILLIGALLSGEAVTAPPANRATPEGAWRVDFGKNRCVAGHAFKTSLGNTLIRLEPNLIGDGVEVAMVFDRPAQTGKKWGPLREGWSVEKLSEAKRYMIFTMGGERRLLTFTSTRADWPANPNVVFTMSFEPGGYYEFPFENWVELQDLMKKCLTEIRADHGITDQLLASIATEPKGNALKFISDNDYPSEAIRNDLQGRTTILFWVETNGRVRDCSVLSSSGSPAIDKQTCSILIRRGKFEPALDQLGKPIRAPLTTSIRWLIPAD